MGGLRLYENDPSLNASEPEISQAGAQTNPDDSTLNGEASSDTDVKALWLGVERTDLAVALLTGDVALTLTDARFQAGDDVYLDDGAWIEQISLDSGGPTVWNVTRAVNGTSKNPGTYAIGVFVYFARQYSSIVISALDNDPPDEQAPGVGDTPPAIYQYTTDPPGSYAKTFAPADIVLPSDVRKFNRKVSIVTRPAEAKTDIAMRVNAVENVV